MPITASTTSESEILTLEEALADTLGTFGWSVTRTGVDLQQRIAEHGSVIRVSVIPGGVVESWQRIARVRVEVFAAKYDKAWQTADAVNGAWLRGPFHAPPWLIDRAVTESDFSEQFYAEGVRLLVAAFRVTTRTVP